MPMVAGGTARWLVSTQVRGELLTTRASAPGLDLVLLGQPAGYSKPDLESWLLGLVRAVHEGTGESLPGDPVPPMLRQALGALLFSHGELWNRGHPPCSVVAVFSDDCVGFGWVGEAAVDVTVDGARAESEWVSIRDLNGREARAWCGVASRGVRVALEWRGEDSDAGVELVAVWAGARTTAPPADSDVSAWGAAATPEPEATEAEAPSTGVARWLAQHVQWDLEPPASGTVEASPGGEPAASGEVDLHATDLPERIPPTPEPEALTAAAEGGAIADASATTAETVEAIAAPEVLAPVGAEPEVSRRRSPPRHPEWPAAVAAEKPRAPRRWKGPALLSGLILALFGAGWFLGSFQGAEGPAEARRPSAALLLLRQIGLAPPRFEVAVVSRPEGAWIAVDGKDLSLRAPATLELAPGEHRVDLSFADMGRTSHTLRGAKNDKLTLDVPMWGTVEVLASEPGAVVNVSLDGQSRGFAPLRIDSVAPGPHELRFSGPGMASWGSTIEVKVGETREVLAYPLQSPATGLLQIRATVTEDGETRPLEGARVWVDGAPRGVTPLTLELPRGPHSVRVANVREDAPVQVIDLPGGNQRFSTFEFGLRSGFPLLTLKAPATVGVEEPALISAALSEVGTADVREMWLHVRSPELRWRRYSMTLMDAQGSVVGAAPFPVALIHPGGTTAYYVSAITTQGDEYFTEMQAMKSAPARR